MGDRGTSGTSASGMRSAAACATESVWDYPRPPRVEPSARRIRVVVDGIVIADSHRAVRVLETSHPPGWYVPAEDVRMDLLRLTGRQTVCEFKGTARYFTISGSGPDRDDAAWSYPRPLPGYEAIAGHIAFYPGRVDKAWVDDERVVSQAGDFYGGWITSDVTGPFKGGPGTRGW
jgi:uncharacterized protein (DUF427 family)